jgi:hypothetical protein
MRFVFRKPGHDSCARAGCGRCDHQPDQHDDDPGPDVDDEVVRGRDDRERHRERPSNREET